MAFIHHRATLSPTKIELLSAWLPRQAWARGGGDLEQVGAYRFDDPEGEVGLEALLVRVPDGTVLHVPLTYRAAALAGADDQLVGTTHHSALGSRWVYDGCGDPVWVAALATAVLTGGAGADAAMDVEGRLETRPTSATVRGSGGRGTPVPDIDSVRTRDAGGTTIVSTGSLELVVARVVGEQPQGAQTLTGTWNGGASVVLAAARAGSS